MANIKTITKEAFNQVELDAMRVNKIMQQSYLDAEKAIIKQMNIVYGKYLTTVKPQDYYNIMIQYDRLGKLLKEVQKEYNNYSKKIDGYIYQIPYAGMTDMYYRQMYVLNWIAPTELSFAMIDPRLVEWSVTGTTEAWKEYNAYLKAKHKNSVKLVKQGLSNTVYNPQYGTLAELLKTRNMQAIAKIRQEVTQSFILGNSMKDVSKNISTIFKTETYKAERIALTELHRVANAAQEIAYDEASEILGEPIKKMWVATLDSRTRSTHQALDGQIADEDGYFHSGGDKAKRPGAFGSASLNIGCRCSTVPIIDDEIPEIRSARNPVTGKKEIIDYADYSTWMSNNGMIKDNKGAWIKK